MILHLIAAHDEQMVIGHNGTMPWHVSRDLKHFKAITHGHTIVMGRGTYESIGSKPLPGRKNIVLSRTQSFDDVITISDLGQLHDHVEEAEDVYIIGGETLYRQTIKPASFLHITLIPGTHDGDTFFPDYSAEIGQTWIEYSREEHEDCIFVDYKRALTT